MLPLLLALTSVPAHASCGSPQFAFVGQPECVSLAFDGQRTHLESRCEAPLLVDDSVLLEETGGPLVAPGAEVALKDLSGFSLGLEGELYAVRAVIAEPSSCATSAGEEPEVPTVPVEVENTDGSWMNAVLGTVAALIPG